MKRLVALAVVALALGNVICWRDDPTTEGVC